MAVFLPEMKQAGWSGEVSFSERAVKFSCFGVVSFGGVYFVMEIPEVKGFSAAGDFCPPLAGIFSQGDALEGAGARAAFLFSVPGVLDFGSGSKVYLSVVESISVNVVDIDVIGLLKQLSVHEEGFAVSRGLRVTAISCGVPVAAEFYGVPVMLNESEVIIVVNDGEFTLR